MGFEFESRIQTGSKDLIGGTNLPEILKRAPIVSQAN